MGRHEAPPLMMVVQNGRLVPDSAYDQERLATYRNGAKIQVSLWQGRNVKLLRKYFAVLHRAVADCPTPWENAEEASDALKMALGITEFGHSVNGQRFLRPGSISFSTMDEAAFSDFYERAMAVLARVTGVDPETLHAESADVGEDNHESSEASPRTDVESGTDNPAPSDGPALDQSEDEADLPEGDAPADNPPPAGDARLRNSMEECLEKFLFAATNAKLEDDRARQDSIVFTKNIWKDELKDRLDFVKVCTDVANKVLRKTMAIDEARAELRRWLP